MDNETVQLEYQERRVVRRQRIRTRMIVSLLVVGMIVAGVRTLPTISTRAKQFYWQRQIERYALPENSVVYEEGSDKHLLSHDPRELVCTQFGSLTIAGIQPLCWKNFDAIAPTAQENFTMCYIFSGVCNLNRMSRIVRVTIFPAPRVESCLTLELGYVEPTKLFSSQQSMHDEMFETYIPNIVPKTQVKFFAGYIDPKDASHFYLPYEVDGVKDQLEGRLRPDGRVTLDGFWSSKLQWYDD